MATCPNCFAVQANGPTVACPVGLNEESACAAALPRPATGAPKTCPEHGGLLVPVCQTCRRRFGQLSDHRCPYCFGALPTNGAKVACPIGVKDGIPCAEAVPRWPEEPEERCPDHESLLVPHCSAPSCGRELPVRWDEVTTTCIAMAGTTSAGKTVYVCMTANLLMRWARLNGLTVTPYDESWRERMESRCKTLDPEKPLYEATQRESPGSEQRKEHQEPILLRIQRPQRKDHVLVLRDIAGEDVQNPLMDAEHFRFLGHADGLLLLIDPSDSAPVRSALVDRLPLRGSGFEPSAVWGNVETLQRHRSVLGESGTRPPVAVAISKFDLVQSAAEEGSAELTRALGVRGSRMLQDPSLRGAHVDAVDAELLDQELRTLCEKYLDFGQLVERAEGYERHSWSVHFFALSALGHAPVVNQVARHGAVPYRCLDPIKWFLWQAGVIRSK